MPPRLYQPFFLKKSYSSEGYVLARGLLEEEEEEEG